MNIKEISSKSEWETFVTAQSEFSFLHSWNWGEFQKALGNKIWRLGIYRGMTLPGAVALIVKVKAKRGSFLFCPHGPLLEQSAISNQQSALLSELTHFLITLAQKEGCSFIRWNPLIENTDENQRMFKELGFKNAPIHIHPETTWVLNITKSEDELLKDMRKTTRYLIRKGIKQNLSIERYNTYNENALKKFYEVYGALAKKQYFTPFSFEYLKNEWRNFDGQSVLFLGKDKDGVKAGVFVVYWSGIGFYHHGASRDVDSNKAPYPYLIQWEAIKEAKRRGCALYNFWGIAPTDYPLHPWHGLSQFKIGFGGEKREYIKTQDLPLDWKYWVNFAVEKLRAGKRGY